LISYIKRYKEGKMKKSAAFLIVLLCTAAAATGGTITVTHPNGGENIVLGSEVEITWTASETTGMFRIVLIRGSSPLGTIIRNLPPGTRSYAWTAGEYEGGTAPWGTNYRIRVREERGTSAADRSNNFFTLSETVDFKPRIRPLHKSVSLARDLQLRDLTVSGTGMIQAVVRSAINRYSGQLMLRMGSEDLTRTVDLPAGRDVEVELVRVEEPIMVGNPCDRPYSVHINPEGTILETNTSNNLLDKRLNFYYTNARITEVFQPGRGGFTARRGGLTTLRPENAHTITRNKVTMLFNVRVKNCGYSAIRSGRLCVWQKGYWAEGLYSSVYHENLIYRQEMSLDPEGDSFLFTVNEQFRIATSEIHCEYIWDEGGTHTQDAVFVFRIQFAGF
jgi:hypothetical protein